MTKYLAIKGNSFGRNELTSGLMRLPDYHWLRSAAREVRRVGKLSGKALNRFTIEWAYMISLDQLNPKDD